jgi:hypothetical protein
MYGRTPFAFQLPKVRRLTGNLACRVFSSRNPGPSLGFSLKSFIPSFQHTLAEIITESFLEPSGNCFWLLRVPIWISWKGVIWVAARFFNWGFRFDALRKHQILSDGPGNVSQRVFLYCCSILYATFGAKNGQSQLMAKVNKTLVNIGQISGCTLRSKIAKSAVSDFESTAACWVSALSER